jgi:multisubunit Na+/H+ antiporter MnhC subunit
VTISLVLLIVMAVLYACGIYLMLERSMTRVLMGFLLVGNATNLLIIAMVGKPGSAPIVDGVTAAEDMTDPLPEALILTAIVITFGVSAFLLALIYRSWRLAKADVLEDDLDDVAMRDGKPGIASQETPGPVDDDTEFGARAEAAVWNTTLDDESDIRNADRRRRRER